MSADQQLQEMAALGVQPAQERMARIELLIGQAGCESRDLHSHYERSRIMAATKGQPIARLVWGDRGSDDGNASAGPTAEAGGATAASALGANVELMDDGVTIRAVAAGMVRLQEGRIWIDSALHIPGHVDFTTGNIEFSGDVLIHGNVVDLFKVISGGSISVAGVIEAAEVQAAGGLIASGGIAARDKGRCQAGHDLIARYITNATVEAGNDVVVQTEVANSRVICGGKLTIEQGTLLAGHITANGGVGCQTLGSPGQVPTIVEVGIDEGLRRLCSARLPEIEAQFRKVQQVKQAVEPFMRNQKTLTAEQRETATELLYNASELQSQADHSVQELRDSWHAIHARAKAQVAVQNLLHAGVILRFPGLETIIRSTLTGPLRIVRRQVDGQWQVAVIADGGYLPLESKPFIDHIMDGAARILGGMA